eukprot:m.287706 g.287706  ORF g.287706 m.287706 type:complete len:87 (-) comp15792_c3_seq4:133-393(-)
MQNGTKGAWRKMCARLSVLQSALRLRWAVVVVLLSAHESGMSNNDVPLRVCARRSSKNTRTGCFADRFNGNNTQAHVQKAFLHDAI